MASRSEQLLVVVSVLEGRHFPKSKRHSLVVLAKFDGEQLSTDPVEHREHPHFSTELAWELDRRMLHQHRLHRTPIKLQCFAVDSSEKSRDCVGYVILDLRCAQEVPQESRWFPLLSSKYTGQRPALLLSLALENDSQHPVASPERFKARRAPPRQSDLLPQNLEAVLIQDQGFHQIGPTELCTDMFVLSVTVAFATKLEQLVTSTRRLPVEGSEFFFYYSLLGNDISSQPFHSLLSPAFEPERASIRIRTNKQILRSYLDQQPELQIHLCCGSSTLGSTRLSLSALSAGVSELDCQPAAVEGVFVLQSAQPAHHSAAVIAADLQPTVGVALTLRKEESSKKVSLPPLAPPTHKEAPPLSPDNPPSPPLPPPSRTGSESESLPDDLRGAQTAGQSGLEEEVEVQERRVEEQLQEEDVASSVTVSAPKVSIPASAHHYCFSLNLHKLKHLHLHHPLSAVLRYSYPFFGSTAPIVTDPPVQFHRNKEVFLPQSHCAFNFAALPQQLQHTFLSAPLVVELWHQASNTRDQLIGTASVQMSALLSAEKSSFQRGCGQQAWRQSIQGTVPMERAQSSSEQVAELCYAATLEDLGLVTNREVIICDSTKSSHPAAQQEPSNTQRHVPVLTEGHAPVHTQGPAAAPTQGPTPARDTLEYRTALELELWKEEQEQLFDDQLRRKELSHIHALSEEWKKRDREREALLSKMETEYTQLEERLQKTLSDLNLREKELAHAETETRRLQAELRAGLQLKQREVEESSRRVMQQCDLRVALEREKLQLLEEDRARLLQQISDGESRYKRLEKEFQTLREQQSIRPEIRLQSEINLLSLEKVELERKLESCTKSKLHYKQQWGRALKELARFKQREQEKAMSRLKKQQAELEAMRLRYLATEEKEVMRVDKQELETIKNDLNRLKENKSGPASPMAGPASSAPNPAPSLARGPSPPPHDGADQQLSRLLNERDSLLRTGLYSHHNHIITELNRRIQQVMDASGVR